jgi:hypothetical protein
VDYWLHFVRIAHLKLRVHYLARHPEILEYVMAEKRPPLRIPMPVELAGMRSRLLRSQQQEKDVGQTGKDYDEVMDRIDELNDAHKQHVLGLQGVESNLRSTIMRMTERPNSDPSDGESDGRQSSSDQGEQEDATDTKPDATGEGTAPPPAPNGATSAGQDGAPLEQLTVNGVTRS